MRFDKKKLNESLAFKLSSMKKPHSKIE